MFEVIILAIALSMDAFAVSIGLGASQKNKSYLLPLKAGLWFGFFQALMPLLGYFAGKGVNQWVVGYTSWISFFLLSGIGGKMIYEGFSEGIESSFSQVTNKILFTLAIATSIDALAAGFTLTLLAINPFLSCAIIGVITFIFSGFGVSVGRKTGTYLENKAEFLGGTILILIWLKILLF